MDHPRKRPRGIGTAAKSENKDLVFRLELIDQKIIHRLNISEQTPPDHQAQGSAKDVLPCEQWISHTKGADSWVVKAWLFIAVVQEGLKQLYNIAVCASVLLASPVKAQDDVLPHLQSPEP